MTNLKITSLFLLAVMLWIVFVATGFLQGFLLLPLRSDPTAEALIEATKDKLKSEFVGNFAMVLIENGQVEDDYFYSKSRPITKQSLFPVA